MSNNTRRSPRDWLHALDVLLLRLRELYPPEERETVGRLTKAFRVRGCVAYDAWLSGPLCAKAWLPEGAECPPLNPTPELETIAIQAAVSALSRIPAYPVCTPPERFPQMTADQIRELNEGRLTVEQRDELERLRLRVIHIAQNRLNRLATAPTGLHAALLDYVQRNLKGRERATIEIVCGNGGGYPLADLAAEPAICWSSPWDDKFNSLRKRVNAKLRRANLPWRLSRQSNCAVIERIGPKSRTEKS